MKKKYADRAVLEKFCEMFQPVPELIGDEVSPVLLIDQAHLIDVMRVLKEDAAYDFDMLSNLTAVDYPEYFEMVYHLFSRASNSVVSVKVRLNKEKPTVSSITVLWPSANFQEREVYDLMGIQFDGHPDLRRILLPDDFEGHPLRKDYQAKARCM